MNSSQLAADFPLDAWFETPNRRPARPSRWSLTALLSVAVHVLIIAAVGRLEWTRLEPAPTPLTDYVWLGTLPVPVESPAVPVEAAPSEPASAPVPQPAVVRAAPPAAVATEPLSVESALTPVTAPVERSESSVAPRTDWDEERRRAIAGALAERARNAEFSAFALDDELEARPQPREPAPSRSIFDSRSSGSSRSFMQPGQARTRLGHKLGELCNALTGGFGLFGFASFCAAADNEPTGLFPEVLPEWRKRMPECEETRPLGPLLAEASRFPTIKCRLVPKDELRALP